MFKNGTVNPIKRLKAPWQKTPSATSHWNTKSLASHWPSNQTQLDFIRQVIGRKMLLFIHITSNASMISKLFLNKPVQLLAMTNSIDFVSFNHKCASRSLKYLIDFMLWLSFFPSKHINFILKQKYWFWKHY